RRISPVFVNWIWSYCTTWTRFPQGSRKSRKRPGRISTPAASSARRVASLSSTTRPKWRARSGVCERPFINAMNWSPISMKAGFRYGLERAHDRRSDRDDAAAPAADGVDEAGGVGGDALALGVGRLVPLGRRDAGVQGDRGDQDAGSREPGEELGCERAAGAR